jgi:hypothetical protein
VANPNPKPLTNEARRRGGLNGGPAARRAVRERNALLAYAREGDLERVAHRLIELALEGHSKALEIVSRAFFEEPPQKVETLSRHIPAAPEANLPPEVRDKLQEALELMGRAGRERPLAAEADPA